MRDPARIDRILSLVMDVWLENPDYRLGQLLINAMRPAEAHPEIFHFEDDSPPVVSTRPYGADSLIPAPARRQERVTLISNIRL